MENFVDKKQRKITKKFKENDSQLCQKAQTKLSDGDIRGALKMLTSQDMIALRNEATIQALEKKHPPPRKYNSTTVFQQKKDNNMSSVTSLEVTKAIESFPNGSAGGLDAIRPQHLKDLTSDVLSQNKVNLTTSLTNLGTLLLLLNGEVPSSICQILYGANLCALKKKDGGIRPIAVGSTIRRLISKIVCRRIVDKLESKFRPHQLGFGTKGGIEAAIHSVRRYLQYPHQSTKVLLKIDFLNAFNMLDRDTILKKVNEEIPEFYNFLNQCYQKLSNLYYYGSTVILSQRGVQQGDPLGPTLFCLGIQSMINSLCSELNIWYMDDGTLIFDQENVFQDLESIISRLKDIGLELNFSKCELAVTSDDTEERNKILEQFNFIAPGDKLLKQDNTYIHTRLSVI
jgi:hypothetical protein